MREGMREGKRRGRKRSKSSAVRDSRGSLVPLTDTGPSA